MFVTTANSLDMPRPLLDRMEIIRLDGYTEQEKIEIAKRHLIPKVFKENAIKPTELFITDDAIRDVIRYYTSESGVRNLERELATIARKSAKELLLDSEKKAEKGGKSGGAATAQLMKKRLMKKRRRTSILRLRQTSILRLRLTT